MPGGVVLGVTPLDVPRPTDGQVAQLTIRFRGYREETVGLTEFSPPTLTRTLVRQREGRGDTMQSMDVAAMEVPVAMDTPPTMMGSSGDGLVNPWDKP
jgi:hypothetical protein